MFLKTEHGARPIVSITDLVQGVSSSTYFALHDITGTLVVCKTKEGREGAGIKATLLDNTGVALAACNIIGAASSLRGAQRVATQYDKLGKLS